MIRKTKENTCGGQIVRTSQELKNLKIVSFPVIGKWEKIPDTNPLIEIKISESPETCLAESEKRQKTTFHLRTCGKNGNKVLYNFIEKCHEEHNSLLRANEDRSTYFYLLQAGGKVKSKEEEDGDGGDAPIQSIFKRYKLTGERDFSTVFFPEKAKILQLVSDFSQRRGKFAIEGFPQKLGLLLHGPPGTGKTSFVKALATHLKRHIISIPLGKISTNQELYDIIFEGLYPCVNASNNDSGTRKCFRHEFKDVIFLMEEVDAATDIVKSRKAAPTQLTQGGHYQGTTFHRETREDPESTKEDSSDESNCELQGENKESVTNTSNSPRKGINKTDDINKIGEPGAVGVNFKSLFSPADKLDLAGLLNVLDGVVDSPGRVVVMTTNHPENLDPALIRPGRINTKLLLTYMKEKEATEMVEQYFGDIDVSNQEKFHKVWESKQRQKAGRCWRGGL